jgi:MtrB/PioB family decaheme-associated outer membrane protein
MNRYRRIPLFRLSLTAMAVLIVLALPSGVRGEDDLSDATVDVGVGLLSGKEADRALFGQHNGLRQRDSFGLLGLEYERVQPDTATVIRLEGIGLLGSTRELDLRWKRQGDWALRAGYAEWVHDDPLDTSAGDDLKVERTRLGVSYSKIIDPRWQLSVSLQSENKKGSRLFGIGFNCPSSVAPDCGPTTGTEVGWAVLIRPEPIDANHSQVDARASYAAGALALSFGYHGSYYRNRYGSLVPQVPANLSNAVGTWLPTSAGLHDILALPVALPPDNQAHQIDLTASYALTPTARANLKLARGLATQHQDFAAAGLANAPAGVGSLGGRVETTLVQVGLSARPLPRTALRARLRYSDRDDRTPLALYGVEGSNSYTNRRLPSTRTSGMVEASYQFSNDVRGTLGVDHEAIDRGEFTPTTAVAGISALRQKTDETGLRADLRRRMNENFSASIGLSSSRRDGSNWLRDNSGVGVTEVPDPSDPAAGLSAGVFMPTLADRQRDKLQLQAHWQPTDELALQFSAQGGRDGFDTPSSYGLRSAGMDRFTVDASYAYSTRWQFTGYASYGHETLRQARPASAVLSLSNISTTLGLGVEGKLGGSVRVGGSVAYLDDRSAYRQALDASASAADAALLAATGGLPDIVLRQGTTKLFARYALDKQSDLQLDLIHQRSTWSDWAWSYDGVPFATSDGTTVGQSARQRVTFVGLRYVYRWQP